MLATDNSALTIAEYLASNHVTVESVVDRIASIPVLPGWSELPADQFPGASQVLVCTGATASGFTPNAVLTHGRLSDAVNPEELLDCAFTDSRRLPDWCDIETSRVPYGHLQSAFIRGTFVIDDWILDATTRYVLSVAMDDIHLTQLTVTTLASRDEDLEMDVTVINLGLTALCSR
ncbi:LpqN/LpqT family lipoprotein [Rhodococcus gannanensis]|uniref:LpqN/LpqT family lipoprotein n=1 Tax=Rhodococcus gannanensis TaxID=1960308 RepID=A0ABW4P307_9NOCA